MPTNPTEGKLFFDGWVSALRAIPDEFLKDSFSDALSTGRPMIPGLVVQCFTEKRQAAREEIKRHTQDLDNVWPISKKLKEAESGREYWFSSKEPLHCSDCGREAEAFIGWGRNKRLLCLYHANTFVGVGYTHDHP